MAKDNLEIAELIAGSLQGTLNEEQLRLLNDWRFSSAENQQLYELLTNKEKLAPKLAVLYEYEQEARRNKLSHRIAPRSKFRYLIAKNRIYYAAAACILIVLSVVYWPFVIKKQSPVAPQANHINDVAPGGNKAMLRLGDDTTIYLDKAKDGSLVQQGGTNIVKQGGTLKYITSNENQQPASVTYNTLTTPKGGQYQVTLPDGSRVWLNAVSSVRYPTTFSENEREIEITGEVYIEVAKEKNKSFRVAIAPGAMGEPPAIIEVLGTSFNVNAYGDEETMKTTLLEGKVRVNRRSAVMVLAQGQQAKMARNSSNISLVKDADIDAEVAWRYGYFQFNNSDLKSVLRQLSRWYDMEIVYTGHVGDFEFLGKIPRGMMLSQVLSILEKQNVHFKIEGKKLIVSP